MKKFLACFIAAALMAASLPVGAAEPERANDTEIPVEAAYDGASDEDYGIMLLRSYSYTAVNVPETALSFSSSDGVSATTIRSTLESLITSHEGSSTSINKNDNGTVSIGRLQFRGELALELMRLVIAADADTAYDILGESLYNEITDSSTSWAARPVNDEEAAAIAELLGKETSLEVQDNYVNSLLSMYLNQAYAEGFRNVSALLYYGDFCNHYGMGSGTKYGKYAINLAGSAGAATANEMHIAAICYLYDTYSSDSERYSASRIPLQRTVYGNIVSVAASNGWTYCQSGDSVIPYNSDGSNGVRWLKSTLNTYMNAGLTVNDSWDSATTAAVKAFQAAEGLTQSGEADEVTSSLLIYRVYGEKAKNGGDIGSAGDTGSAGDAGSTGDPEDQRESDDTSGYNGFHRAPNTDDWYYYTNGEVDTKKTDVIKGTVNGITGWWNVVNGKVTPGVTVAKNSNGWWYIDENGMVDFSACTIAKNKNGWWYVEDGKVDFGYNGFGQNEYGCWYCESGKVTFTKQGILKDSTGAIGEQGDWYYVIESKVQTDFTGLSNFSNSNGWWYIVDGRVDFTHNGVDKNKNGWWYVTGGKVQFGFTGLANYKNSYGWWYIVDGAVDFTHNGVDKNKNGWWYVTDGKVQFDFTGLADYKNSYGWWYIVDGAVDFTHNGVDKNKNGWWYVKDGKVDFSYSGSAQNSNGWWYISGGKVDFNTGTVVKEGSDWLYYFNGVRDAGYSGVAANENGWWYVYNGKVLFDDALTYAAEFVGTNSSSGKSAGARLEACYEVLWKTYSYERTYGDSPSASVMSQYAVDMFKNKKGNCYRYAASFACIAKVLGYDSRVAVGEISSTSGGMTAHGWTEVYEDGQWLICDPDMQMNHPNINSYMRTESNYAYKHTCSARYTLKVTESGAVWE